MRRGVYFLCFGNFDISFVFCWLMVGCTRGVCDGNKSGFCMIRWLGIEKGRKENKEQREKNEIMRMNEE